MSDPCVPTSGTQGSDTTVPLQTWELYVIVSELKLYELYSKKRFVIDETFQGNVYCINAPDDSRDALFNSIVYGKTSGSGKIELICNGRNCMAPAMISRFPEEPLFPEFLTIREFLKYYIDMNRSSIKEVKSIEEYLELGELSNIRGDRLLRDFTLDERVRLQYLCFLITMPTVLIIDSIKNIRNVDFLKKIKNYLDCIKENGIVLVGCRDKSISVFIGDEELSVVDGKLRGGR